MDRTKNEKKRIERWAEETKEFWFTEIDKKLDSYFCVPQTNSSALIYPYKFCSIVELKKMMRDRKMVVHDEMVDKVCAVAAFKEREQENTICNDSDKSKDNGKLPEFIYNM